MTHNTENDARRETVARLVDAQAFTHHALTWRPNPGGIPSNWQNRRDTAYRKADELIAMLVPCAAPSVIDTLATSLAERRLADAQRYISPVYGEQVAPLREEVEAEARWYAEAVAASGWTPPTRVTPPEVGQP